MASKKSGRLAGIEANRMDDEFDDAEDGGDEDLRIHSVGDVADLLGRHRNTIGDWIKAGCPVAIDEGRGREKFLDLKAVLAWREEQARNDERRKHSTDGGGETPMSPSDLVKLEDLKIKRQKLAMMAKILVHREPMQHAIRQANGLARQTVMSIPEQIVRKVGGAVTREKLVEIQQMTWTLCAAALTSWSNEINAAMQATAERLMTFEDIEGVDDVEE